MSAGCKGCPVESPRSGAERSQLDISGVHESASSRIDLWPVLLVMQRRWQAALTCDETGSGLRKTQAQSITTGSIDEDLELLLAWLSRYIVVG